jgi:sugar phosphate isomerase/epimerase
MFTPRLGVSLHCLGHPVDGALLNALRDSEIATLELMPILFGGNAAARTALRATMLTSGVRAATVHAMFGGHLDVSSFDDDIRSRGLGAYREVLDLAVEFEAQMIVVHPSAEPIADDERDQRLARAVDALASLTDNARELGVRIAVELLPRTCLGNTVDELQRIVADLDPAVFGICLDVNHLMDRPHTLPDAVRQLGPQLITLHLSDYDGVDEKHWLPGAGVLDWAAFLQALRDIDYAGPFNYEAKIPGDTPAEKVVALRENFAWLAGL